MASPQNPTGFDVKQFARAATSPEWRARDPWRRAYVSHIYGSLCLLTMYSEAWRYTGPFTRWNRFKGAFPGFGYGLAAFLLYSAYEAATGSGGHGHGEMAAH